MRNVSSLVLGLWFRRDEVYLIPRYLCHNAIRRDLQYDGTGTGGQTIFFNFWHEFQSLTAYWNGPCHHIANPFWLHCGTDIWEQTTSFLLDLGQKWGTRCVFGESCQSENLSVQLRHYSCISFTVALMMSFGSSVQSRRWTKALKVCSPNSNVKYKRRQTWGQQKIFHHDSNSKEIGRASCRERV